MNNNKEQGMVMVMVVILGAIAIMLGTALLTTSVLEVKSGNYYENDAQAYFVARSGAEIIEKAIINGDIVVDNDNDLLQSFNGTINGHTYNVDVNRDSSNSQKIVIDAIGDIKGVDDRVTLNLKEEINNSGGNTIQTDMVLFSNDGMTISGGAKVKGNVVSNNNVNINNNGKVDGNITINANRSYEVIAPPILPIAEDVIIGNQYNFNAGIRDGEMRAGGNSAPFTLNMIDTGNVRFNTIRIRGKELTIKTGDIDRIIVVDNLINEWGSGELKLEGNGNLTIFVNEEIYSSGGATNYSNDSNSDQLRIIYNGNSTVTLDNDFRFYGMLYALNSTIHVKSHLSGCIIAKEIIIDNGARIEYNSSNDITTIPTESDGGNVTYERINFE